MIVSSRGPHRDLSSLLAAGTLDVKRLRAGEFWSAGEKALAQIRLAFIGLPKVDETGVYRLFLAGTALEKGVSPSELMKTLGFPRGASNCEKYSPDQPRVLIGEHRAWLLQRIANGPDMTLRGLVAELAEQGVKVSYRTVWNFVHREKISYKKKAFSRPSKIAPA